MHPRTGLLRENAHHKSWNARERAKRAAADAERAARMREIGPKTQLHKLKDGVWWEVKLGKIGNEREPDVIYAAKLSALPPLLLYGREARAISKRQLNKADKKKYGLD